MKYCLFYILLLVLTVVNSQTRSIIKTYFPIEKDSSGTAFPKKQKEVFQGFYLDSTTVKTGKYTLFFDYPADVISISGNYTNNIKSGVFKYYYQNEQLKYICSYKNGNLTGEEKYYSVRGDLTFSGNYQNTISIIGIDTVILSEYNSYYPSGKLRSDIKMKNYIPHGLCIDYYQNDTKMREFTFTEGKKNGPFIIFSENGQKIQSGNYEDDLLTAQLTSYFDSGERQSITSFTNNLPNGFIKEFQKNGTMIRFCHYKMDTIHGTCEIYYDNGNLRTKENFYKGMKNGTGTNYYESGQLKDSTQFKAGARVGKQIQYYENGVINGINFYIEDKLNGICSYFYDNEKPKAIFHYENGKKTGKQTTYYLNGNTKTVEVINKEHLPLSLKEYNQQGKLIRATSYTYQEDPNFTDQLVTLKYIITKDETTGKKRTEQNFYNKQKHGYFVSYNENGKVGLKEEYRFDNLHNERIVYFENGKVKSKEYYLAGRKTGIWFKYSKNVKLIQITSYRNDKKDGLEKRYFENGELKSEGSYLKNKKNGSWKYYNNKGAKIKTEKYSKGILKK
jgi:antitoxin component YwqK of YwqJK toxin-antitoxin module